MLAPAQADIIATIPPERLLLWGPQDGWEPLCNFLGRDVPQVKMPYVNDAAATEAVWEGACAAGGQADARQLLMTHSAQMCYRRLSGVCCAVSRYSLPS